MSKGTLIHGIAASDHLDSSGERLSIEGLDISSLERDGVLNYEHKNDSPSQIVGKILKAKKIFKEEDCEDQNQLKFWKMSGSPFVYIIGELFDAVGHQQAKEVAAMLRYDNIKKEENPKGKNLVNFSVEGSKLEKKGQEITRSIARKISITITPCNKVAVAEEYKPAPIAKKESLLFKSETDVEVLSKALPYKFTPAKAGSALSTTPNPPPVKAVTDIQPKMPQVSAQGSMIGTTKSGKEVFSHSKPGAYGKQFTSQDHHDAGSMHYEAAEASKNPAVVQHHLKQMKNHFAVRDRIEKINEIRKLRSQNLGKTLTAGSGNVAPSARSGMAALTKESLDEAAKSWPKYEKALNYISKEKPQLDKSEAELLAKYMAYRAVKRAEKGLAKMSVEDLEKSKNVREQRKKVFGTDPNAPRLSDKRMKMMQYIRDYARKKYGSDLQVAQGKRDREGELREEADLAHEPFDVFTPEGHKEEKKRLARLKQKGIKRVDPKPHWHGDTLETQPSPDAAVHELAHLDLAPEGRTPEDFQFDMDAAYARHGKEYGHAQGKRTAWEVQPMAIENPIRREMGLPANRTTKEHLSPEQIDKLNAQRAKRNLPPLETDPETGIELTFDDKRPRFHRGTNDKYYDRQSRLQSPETEQRVEDIRSGTLKFHPSRGWYRADDTNALINLRGQGRQEEATQRLKGKYKKSEDDHSKMVRRMKVGLGYGKYKRMMQDGAFRKPDPDADKKMKEAVLRAVEELKARDRARDKK